MDASSSTASSSSSSPSPASTATVPPPEVVRPPPPRDSAEEERLRREVREKEEAQRKVLEDHRQAIEQRRNLAKQRMAAEDTSAAATEAPKADAAEPKPPASASPDSASTSVSSPPASPDATSAAAPEADGGDGACSGEATGAESEPAASGSPAKSKGNINDIDEDSDDAQKAEEEELNRQARELLEKQNQKENERVAEEARRKEVLAKLQAKKEITFSDLFDLGLARQALGCTLTCVLMERVMVHWPNSKQVRVMDSQDDARSVFFYTEEPEPYFSLDDLKDGVVIVFRSPNLHFFMDGQMGLRVEDASLVSVHPNPSFGPDFRLRFAAAEKEDGARWFKQKKYDEAMIRYDSALRHCEYVPTDVAAPPDSGGAAATAG
eukprot:RCo044692